MRAIIVWASLSLFLSACGGGGGGSDAPLASNGLENPITGVLIDSAVSGVNYSCSSGNTGVTNALGEFTCETGDTVSFSIAGISLGEAVAVTGIITPSTLFPSNPQAALNLAQLLQTIDSDGDPSNGITPSADLIESLKNVTIDLTSSTFDTGIQTILDSSGVVDANGAGFTLVTEGDAQEHLNDTFAELDINADGTENTSNFTIGGSVTGLTGSGLVLQNNSANNLSITANGSYSFSTQLENASTYSIAVLTNPSTPSQTCTVSNANGTLVGADISNVAISCVTTSYTVSVTVNGLIGSGFVLKNNNGDDLTVSANGTATFSSPIADLSNYLVTVSSAPTLPSQSCSVVNATGTINGANSTTTAVSCAVNSFTIGGNVSGLNGNGLVLQNNGGDNVTISADGAYSFSSSISDLSNYNVSVISNPSSPKQTCSVANAAGSVNGANVNNANINCITEYNVGGTVTGLTGTGLVLQNNLGNDLVIASDGSFTFTSTVSNDQNYSVSVLNHASAPSQTCAVTQGTGTLNNADITNVSINCVTGTFSVGGTVTGLTGTGLVLQNNGGNNLSINADGSFTFTSLLADQTLYSVSVKTQPNSPSQLCTVNSASGTIAAGSVSNVSINCVTQYGISGGVSGLVGTVVIQNNGGDDLTLSSNGAFSFATPITNLTNYSVSVLTNPASPNQTCTVGDANGTLNGAAITNVSVECSTHNYTVGGTVNGLEGSELTLKNNAGDTLNIVANGNFTFATPLTDLSAFAVTIGSQATSPQQTCSVTNGTGTLAGTNEADIVVNCLTHYRIGGVVNGTPAGLVLQYNAANNQTINSDGTFFFSKTLVNLQSFTVSVLTQPTLPSRTCVVSNPSGTLSGADATATVINCTYDTFSISGTISGLTGNGLVLQNKSTDDLAVAASATTFVFATQLTGSNGYNVSIATQPTGQSCVITPGEETGDVNNADVNNISINCSDSVSLGGNVTGLSGSGLQVQNNAGDTLGIAADGSYSFASKLSNSDVYSVSVLTQPTSPSQTCVVSNATGTASTVDISNVNISCSTASFSVSGTVSGLLGTGLILQNNNAEDSVIAADGAYTAFSAQTDGETYNVTVYGQPVKPRQTCSIANPAATLNGNNVTNVNVVCIDDIAPQLTSITPVNKAWGASSILSTNIITAVKGVQMVDGGADGTIAIWTYVDTGHKKLVASKQLTDGTWQADETISDPVSAGVSPASDPQIGADATGNALAVWRQTNGSAAKIWINRYIVGSGWSGATLLNTDDIVTHGINSKPQLAVASNGDAVVLWETFAPSKAIRVTSYKKSTDTWSAVQTLADRAVSSLNQFSVAINATGQAVAIWRDNPSNITTDTSASFYTEASGWSAVEKIDKNTRGFQQYHDVAMDSSGNVVAVWLENDANGIRIWSNRLTASDGLWKTAKLIEDNAISDALIPKVVMDANANATVMWITRLFISGQGYKYDVWANYSSIANGWEKAKTLESTDKPIAPSNAQELALAINANGDVTAAWVQRNAANNYRIFTNRFISNKHLWQGAVETLGLADSVQPSITIKANGTAVIGYNRSTLPKALESITLSNQTVAPTTTVTAMFDETMMASSIGSASFTLNDGNAVAATVVYDSSTKTATLTPDETLARLSTYTATLDTSIADTLGNALAPTSWTFTTKDGDWGTALNIETGTQHASEPQITFDKSGNGLAVWKQKIGGSGNSVSVVSSYYDVTTGIWVQPTIDVGGTLEIFDVDKDQNSTHNALTPKVKFDGSGNATAVWAIPNGSITTVYSNRYTKGSGWDNTVSSLQINGVNNDSAPEIAVSDNGDAMVVYKNNNSLYANRFYNDPQDGLSWWGPQLLETRSFNANSYKVGLDKNGNAIAVWSQIEGAELPSRIWMAKFDQATNTWSTPIAISDVNETGSMGSPDLSVNANGDAMVVWYKPAGEEIIQARSYKASTDTWGTVSTIQSILTDSSYYPKVALSDNGNAVAVWAQYHEVDGIGRTQAWSNYFNVTAGWATAQEIDNNNYGVDGEAQTIIDSEGNAMAIWYGTDSSDRQHIEANRYLVGQGWSTSVLIEENADGNAEQPQLAVDAKGKITAIWTQRDSSSILNIWVNRFE